MLRPRASRVEDGTYVRTPDQPDVSRLSTTINGRGVGRRLESNILQDKGIREAIVVWQDVIVDGH